MMMNEPKPIYTPHVSMKNSPPTLTRRCSRELQNLLATSSSPMMASTSMPVLHRNRSLTKRSSSGRLAHRTLSSKWSSDEGVKYRRRRSSKKLPGPNAEFDTFGDSSVAASTATSSLLLEKVERAIIGSNTTKKITGDTTTPARSNAATESASSAIRARTATPPPAARSNVPDDASSTITPQPNSSHPSKKKEHQVVKANVKYNNEAGRAAVLAVCEAMHHDFGQLNNIINVTLPADELENLAENPDVTWIDRSGAVYFMQPYQSAK